MSNNSALATDNNHLPRGGMSSREIKAGLILRGISIKEIAGQAGVTTSAVIQIINRYNCSRYKGYRVRPYIAAALGKSVDEIWPE